MSAGGNAGKTVGENALERTLRQLGTLNTRFADPDVRGMETLTLRLDRNGNAGIENTSGEEIYEGTLEQVIAFLAAPAAKQVALIRGRI